MKTIPLYLILASGISLSVFSQEKAETNFQEQKLHGHIKTLTETWYQVEKKFLHNHRNKNGNTELYLFDTSGNVTECLGIYTGDSSAGNMIRYGFDGKGNPTMTIQCDFKGRLLSEIRFKYDEYGNRTESIQYDSSGTSDRKSEYSYFSIDILAKVTDYDGDGRVIRRSFPAYDLNGHPCGWSTYDTTGILQNKEECRYDEQAGRWIHTCYVTTDTIPRRYDVRYNEAGEVAERDSYNGYGDTLIKTTYEYDKFDRKKNWRRERAFENGKPGFVYEREIKYYQ